MRPGPAVLVQVGPRLEGEAAAVAGVGSLVRVRPDVLLEHARLRAHQAAVGADVLAGGALVRRRLRLAALLLLVLGDIRGYVLFYVLPII